VLVNRVYFQNYERHIRAHVIECEDVYLNTRANRQFVLFPPNTPSQFVTPPQTQAVKAVAGLCLQKCSPKQTPSSFHTVQGAHSTGS